MQGILQSPGEMGVPDKGHMEAWHLPGCREERIQGTQMCSAAFCEALGTSSLEEELMYWAPGLRGKPPPKLQSLNTPM